MNMITEQERTVERLITQTLNELSVEQASLAIDSLIFSDHVVSRKPENISPAVTFYIEAKYRKELSEGNLDLKEIAAKVNNDIISGKFNMRYFYPDTRDLVELDEKYESYSKYLKDEGVIIPGMDGALSSSLTRIAYFSQHLVGDISDYGEIKDTIHQSIKQSIPTILNGGKVKASDMLRLKDESEDEPLNLLQGSHLTKKLATGNFVKEHNIKDAIEAVRRSSDLNQEYEGDSFSP